ncbi:MAG: DUF1190 domain-containing protein [Pseudomonadota bacterium]
MKRSQQIRLVLLGSASAIALTACDQTQDLPKDAKFFRDQAQCEAEVKNADCKKAFEESRDAHVQTAPRFGTLQECQNQYGVDNCTPATPPGATPPGERATAGPSGGFFMPLMIGYMLGRSGGNAVSQPVYRDANNTAYAGGRSAGRAIGRIDQASLPAPKAAPGSRGVPDLAAARGGFGQAGQSAAS